MFVHPAIRPYRAHLYQALQERFDTRFYVLGAPELNHRWATHYGIVNLEVLPQGAFLPYRTNVSWRLLNRAWRDDYDVWIGSTLYAFSTHAAFPIVRARHRPFALFTEDWYWGGDRASRAIEPYLRTIVRCADLLIAAGTAQADFLVEQGAPADRVRMARNSYVPGPTAGDVERDRSRTRVLYLGRLLDYKGPQVLIRAFAAVERAQPDRAELVICGGGPAEADCRRLVSELKLRSVRFAGRIDPAEVGAAYRAADLFVHPCLWHPNARVKGEAWGFVINEAMAAGLPVITTTAVGAARDLVRDGDTGYVVAPGDVPALAARLLELVYDDEARRRMGARARAVIDAEFRPEQQAAAFCDAVDDLARRRTTTA